MSQKTGILSDFIPSAPVKVPSVVWEEISDCMGCLPCGRCCVGLSKPPSCHDTGDVSGRLALPEPGLVDGGAEVGVGKTAELFFDAIAVPSCSSFCPSLEEGPCLLQGSSAHLSVLLDWALPLSFRIWEASS